MTDTYRSVQEAAIEAALQAGREILAVYATDFGVSYKADDSPVTRADTRADRVIRDFLSARFPSAGILSEESPAAGDLTGRPLCFIVDPLDGTREFVKRNGEFCVNIALAADHRAVMGVVYAPVARELYAAREGGGAWLYPVRPDHTLGEPQRLRVSDRTTGLVWIAARRPSRSLQALLDEHREKAARFVWWGSALKGCQIARGEADVYYRFGSTTHEWDTAAVQVLVEEAGGRMGQLDGSPLRYNRRDHRNHGGFYIANRPENVWVGTGR